MICVCALVAVVWVVLGVLGESRRAAETRFCERGVVLYMGVLCVWIICVDDRSGYLYFVIGGYLVILGAPSVHLCCTLSISAS